MPTYTRTLQMALIVLFGLFSWGLPGAIAAPGTSGANVAQGDLFVDWSCPAMTFSDIPGLPVSRTTQGGPVLLMVTVNVSLPEGSSGPPVFDLDPVLDGQQLVADRSTWITNALAVLAFSRVYLLVAGGHTFGVRVRCPPFSTIVTRAWLTVYELPPVRR